jgi:hypothetical protein
MISYMMLLNLINSIIVTIIPPTLFICDLINFAITGSGYFLSSYYLIELINHGKKANLIYIISFIIMFSVFQQNQFFILISISISTLIALKLRNILTNLSLPCYILSSLNIILVSLLKWLFFGLKIGFFYTASILFANMIIVYLSLKFLTRCKLGSRA